MAEVGGSIPSRAYQGGKGTAFVAALLIGAAAVARAGPSSAAGGVEMGGVCRL